jgi:hypothetical protein
MYQAPIISGLKTTGWILRVSMKQLTNARMKVYITKTQPELFVPNSRVSDMD